LFCELGCSRAAADELVGKVRCDILDPSQYKLFDDAVPTLTQLQREGWHHVVLSDHVPELEGLIRGLGIADHFERVFTSARIGFEKPHPRIFEVALAEISFVGPIWMLGDSVDADCFPARHLGIDAILVRTNDERYRPRAADLPGAVELISRPTASPAPPSGRR
jgi:putative hydrolase of the HAD superfamily